MTKGEHTRLVAWRWRLLCRATDDGNVARTCRHVRISRKSFYKWKRRLEEHGQAGLGDRADVPHGSPRATGCLKAAARRQTAKANTDRKPGRIRVSLGRGAWAMHCRDAK